VAFVGVVSLSVDGPCHDLFSGSDLHELLLAYHYGDPIDFVVILRETGNLALNPSLRGSAANRIPYIPPLWSNIDSFISN